VPARVRLALIVFATLSILGASGVILFAKPEPATRVSADGFAGAVSPSDIAVRDFSLRDQDGKPVSLREYRGRVVVLTFMYSTCQDTCPVTAQTIRGALDQVGHDVPVLAVSVDPAHDTRDSAERFLVKQSMSAGRMRFLLGSRAQLQPIWKAYGIQPQGKGFEHTAYVAVLDQTGRQRVAFTIDHLTDRDLAHDIRKLEATRS
jgi:protein SCO1/2